MFSHLPYFFLFLSSSNRLPPSPTPPRCLTSGKGIMCTFTGPGTFWVQSRNEEAFRDWVGASVGKKGRAGTRNTGSLGGIIVFALVILIFIVAIVIIAMSDDPQITVNGRPYRR